MASPFIWQGNTGQISTPEQARRANAVADALAANRMKVANNGWEGLAQMASLFPEYVNRNNAAAAEEAGLATAAEALAGIGPESDFSSIASALANPWLSDSQATVASALLQQNLQRSDPMYQAQLAQLTNPQQDPTASIQNFEYLVGRGVDPARAEALSFGGGGTTVNNMGNIPAGYQVDYDEAGRPVSMSPVPGSPAFIEAELAASKIAASEGARNIVTDTIVTEANNAREAAKGFAATGLGNAITGGAGFTPAGEVNRSVASLKAIAASENINAMRQQSPTGGALGAVSDADLKLLQDKAGALDPQSPSFERQLDDYERTLLRIVHGYETGDAIYNQTRPATSSSDVDSILGKYGV